MKLINKRNTTNYTFAVVGCIFLLLPIYGLVSGEIIVIGRHQSGIYYKAQDTIGYWLFISLYFLICTLLFVLSKYRFPLYDNWVELNRAKAAKAIFTFDRFMNLFLISAACALAVLMLVWILS